MSVATAPRARHSAFRLPAVLRVGGASDAVVVGGLLVWTLAFAAITWGRWGDLTMDTGYDLLAGARAAQGDLPYVDYVYYYGPVGPLLLGGIYAITGPAVWPAVALGLLVAALAIGLTYRLARRFAAPLPSGAAAALVAVAALSGANNSYVLPHSVSAPLAVVFALAALLLLVTPARERASGRSRLVLAGVACGLAAVTRLELALPFCAAVALWLAIEVWRAGDLRRASLRDAATVLLPAAGLPLVVYGLFATQVPPEVLLWENLYPREFIAAAGSVILDAHAPRTAASLAELAAHTVAYAAGIGVMVAAAAAIAAGGRPRRVAIAALAVGVTGFLLVLAARPETVRYYLQWAYAWIPAGAWLAAAYALRSRQSHAALICLALGAVTATTYASFLPFPNALHPEATVYLLPIAAVFLAWLHASALPARVLGTGWIALLAVASAGLAVVDARPETATVSGPGGSIAARPADALALQRALDLMATHTRAGEPVLIAPQLTALYVMADRRNPLPQLSLLPGALATPAAEERAIARMREVRFAVTSRTPLTLYEHGAFGTTFDARVAAWLRRNFQRVQTIRGPGADSLALDVWLRRTP